QPWLSWRLCSLQRRPCGRPSCCKKFSTGRSASGRDGDDLDNSERRRSTDKNCCPTVSYVATRCALRLHDLGTKVRNATVVHARPRLRMRLRKVGKVYHEQSLFPFRPGAQRDGCATILGYGPSKTRRCPVSHRDEGHQLGGPAGEGGLCQGEPG